MSSVASEELQASNVIDGSLATLCASRPGVSNWVSIQLEGELSSRGIDLIVVHNFAERPAWLGSFEVWLGDAFGDTSSSSAVKCGEVLSLPAESNSGPLAISCGGARRRRFVTLQQTGPVRMLVLSEIDVLMSSASSDPPPVLPPIRPPVLPPTSPAPRPPYSPPPAPPTAPTPHSPPAPPFTATLPLCIDCRTPEGRGYNFRSPHRGPYYTSCDSPPCPLFLGLHGSGCRWDSWRADFYTHFNRRAVVAFPMGHDCSWSFSDLVREENSYLARVIDDIAKRINIDRGRVYVFGYSAGANMATLASCYISWHLAGVLSLAGAHYNCPKAPWTRQDISGIYTMGDGDSFFGAAYEERGWFYQNARQTMNHNHLLERISWPWANGVVTRSTYGDRPEAGRTSRSILYTASGFGHNLFCIDEAPCVNGLHENEHWLHETCAMCTVTIPIALSEFLKP